MKKTYFFAFVIFSFVLFAFGCEDTIEGDTDDDIDTREEILGTWNVSEYSETFKEQYYTVDIRKVDGSEDEINIYNFFNLGNDFSVKAKMENLKLTIPQQEVDKYVFQGGATIQSSYRDMNFTFTVDFGQGTEEVNASYTNRPISVTPPVEVIAQNQ